MRCSLSLTRRLRLFEAEGYRVDVQSPRVRRYLLKETSAMDNELQPEMLFASLAQRADIDPYSDPPDGAGAAADDTPRLAARARLSCKMCRHDLAFADHVVQHEPGKGELAFEPHKRDSVRRGNASASVARQKGAAAGTDSERRGPALLHSRSCSAFYVEPLKWMIESSDVVDHVVSGKLACPNRRCSAKLGNWSWAGSQCGWCVSRQCSH